MSIAKNRAAILARAREAGPKGEAPLCARGDGTVRGLPVEWRRVVGAGAYEEIRGAYAGMLAWDGARGWRVDPSGMPGALDLADLEAFVVAQTVWSGRWLREDAAVIVEDAMRADALVVRARFGATAFILELDAGGHPRRLVRVGRDDDGVLFDDIRGGIPHRIIHREAWLEDVLVVQSTEDTDLVGEVPAPPEDATFDDARSVEAKASRRGLPLVRGHVDGADLGWFLLDTGAGALALDAAMTEPLGLRAVGRSAVRTADGIAVATYRRARSLEVGPLSIEAPTFVELDLAPFSRALGTKLAGVLGYDFLMRSAVTIDAGVVSLRRPGTVPAGARLRFEGGRAVVAARFPGRDGAREGLFAIDTGSASAVTFHAGAAALAEMRGGARTSLQGVSGSVAAHARTIAWFELAGERLDDVDVLVASATTGVTGDTSTGAEGVIGSIGMGLLRSFVTTLDYRTGSAVFMRRRPAGLRAPAR